MNASIYKRIRSKMVVTVVGVLLMFVLTTPIFADTANESVLINEAHASLAVGNEDKRAPISKRPLMVIKQGYAWSD